MDSYLFAKVDPHFIEELMQSPELVTEVLLDVGFDLEAVISEDTKLNLLEQRWQGLDRSFSLENIAKMLPLVLQELPSLLKLVLEGGRKSTVMIEQITQDHIEIFWLLFQGLCSYFQSASEAKECVLRVATKYDA